VVIPKTVELACYALTVGVETFDGALPAREEAVAEPAASKRLGSPKPRLRSRQAA